MQVASNQQLQNLRVDGGASVMDLLLQLQADQLQVPVLRPQSKEITALGAAFLAGLSVGIWTSLSEVAEIWKLDVQMQPEMDRLTVNKVHARWLQAVERSRSWAISG